MTGSGSGRSSVSGPNELWLTDITEHRTGEGKLYLCAIKDAYSTPIVADSISDPRKSRLAVAALNNAVATRGDSRGLHRLVEPNQFRSRRFVHFLNRHDIVGSMGRVGAVEDNAAMESFFSLPQKKKVLDRRDWATREELRIAIVT